MTSTVAIFSRLALGALVAALIGFSAAEPAHAQFRAAPDSLGAGWRPQQDEARRGVREQGNIPLDQVIQQIARRTPGRPLDAGLETHGGRPVYRVRWDAEGRRIDYIVDARTGAILRTE